MQQSRNGSLDQLRALAIIPVVTHHFYSPWLPGGGLGVIVFFVLSGYLIGQSLKNDTGGRLALAAKFTIRRTLRILPMYYLAVAVALVTMALWSAPHLHNTLEALPQILTMTRRPYSPPGYSIEVMWSLYVEVAFYGLVALSVLVFGFKRITTPVFLCCATVLSFLLTDHPYSLLGCMFIGLSLHSSAVSSIKLKRPTLTAVACVVLIIALYRLLDVERPVDSNFFFMSQYVVAAATAVFILSTVQGARIPLVPGAPFIGRISYSLYLVHAQVLDCLNNPSIIPPSFVQPWFYPALCLSIASITYFLVERPYNRYAHFLCGQVDGVFQRAAKITATYRAGAIFSPHRNRTPATSRPTV